LPRRSACAGCLALVLAGWAAGVPAREDSPLQGLGEIKDVTIVVADEPCIGDLLPAPTSSEFRFRLAETGDVLAFRWSSLEDSERKRVQKLYGIEVAEEGTHVRWGEKLPCVRVKLATKKSLEGYELPERALPGYRCFKTPTQVFLIPAADVEAEEKIEKRESEVFSPEEGLERLLARRPPAADSANDHLRMARECAQMSLYAAAIEYLEITIVLDKRVEEQTREFRAELLVKHAETQAQGLYRQITRDMFREDHASALQKCLMFLRNFPSSELKTRIEALLPDLTVKQKADLAKRVIFMFYTQAGDLIQARLARKTKVDAHGRPVPAVPGKQITTKEQCILRGTLVSDTPEMVTIQRDDDLTVQVPRSSILTMQDVDLSKSARSVPPSFAELKAYVTDAQGGLGRDIVRRISETLKVDDEEVRGLWESRFQQTAVYSNGELKKTPIYVTDHTASYGKGSWLREGVAPHAGNRKLANIHPEYSDDPEQWWSVQSGATKFDVLKALAAEKLFRPREIRNRACPECGGQGALVSTGGGWVRCPMCRGLKVLFVVRYR
jgi:hypothetical protein